MLNYDEFKKLVPEETAKLLKFSLPYLNYYATDGRNLEYRKTEEVSNNYFSKFLFLLLYAMAQNPEYETLLSKFGFDKSRIKVEKNSTTSSKTEEALFAAIGSIIPSFDDVSQYETLTPIDILMPILDKYWNICTNKTIYNELLSRSNFSTFKSELSAYNQSKKVAQERDLEQTLYGNLPITVISYLETASKVRSLLFKKVNSASSDGLKKLDEDIVPISLLLATFYYKDTPIYVDENVSEQTAIKDYLNIKGITVDKILQNLSINLGVREVSEVPRNLIAIKNLYRRYALDGIFKGEEQSSVTVRGIIENVFDRDFTNSVSIEKLFAKMNCYIGMFDHFEETISHHIETQRRNYSIEYVKSFYSNLAKETREFADFAAKIYILLLQKMKENKHNSKLLFAEDDADTLALLIASYYFDGDVSEFFEDYGITLEKILALLNIALTKEEIEAVELNQKVLVDRYRRFVYEGVNRGKAANNISIEDIDHNLCDRGFNRSMIMESIFSELTDEMNLESDFLKQLQLHLEQKERNRKMKLSQRLFRDMPIETVEILENASRVHSYLKTQQLENCSIEDIKSLSLLWSILVSSETEAQNYLLYLGFTEQKIRSIFKVNSFSLSSCSIDIDLLVKEYGNYIFGGCNKGKKREELTPLAISKNIFSKEINNSVTIGRFLAAFGQSYESYSKFDDDYRVYQTFIKEQQGKEEAEKLVQSYGSASQFLINVFGIYQLLKSELEKERICKPFITSFDDLKELSMLLALWSKSNESRKFFKKHNITIENILAACGLDSSLVSSRPEQIDFLLGVEAFGKYFEKDSSDYRSRRTVDDFARRIFDTSINESMVLENLAAQLGANYDILREEVETGKDYELSLTIDDRIALLAGEAIDTLDLGDIRSVLHFGNSLSVHSKYIHDELPKLMLSDGHQASIDTINSIIGRVYEKKVTPAPQKKGFFASLFSISVDEPSSPEYVLNPVAIAELKESIDSNISNLSNELLGYDSIRKYIEVYRRKNRTHYMVATDTVDKIRDELSTLDPQKDEEYERFLTATSRLQIMSDKANRFATTNHIMQQELLKVNQAIVNHFVTINALEMARDDLLPLIGSELALGQGRNTENRSLELSQNVMQLFQSLLDRNVDSAVENMEQLRRTSLSADVFESLNRDIQVYLQGLDRAGHINSRIESLDSGSVGTEWPSSPQAPGLPDTDSINLTLNPDTTKQKRIGFKPIGQ